MKTKSPFHHIAALFALALLATFGATHDAKAQTLTIDFDTAGNWTLNGSGYQSTHVYADEGWTFTGGPALRNGTTAQDGFAGALGTYSWRLENNSAVSWTVTYNTGGTLSAFGFDVRRWDGSPSPNFLIEYSINGGTSFTSTGTTINNTFLGNSSDWTTFSFDLSSSPPTVAADDFIVRVAAQGTTERVMIDNFSFTLDGGGPVVYTTWTGTGNGGTWSNGGAGNFGGNYADDLANTVTFAGTAETVATSGTPQAGSVTFNSDGFTVTGAVQLGVGTVEVGNVAHTATISADISGDSGSGLTKSGNGLLVLSGDNSFTGETEINNGVVQVRSANALGTTGSGTIVGDGASLELAGTVTTAAEVLSLNGAGVSGSGALRNLSGNNTYAGAITLGTDARINSTADTLTVTGGITGTGQVLTVSGAGDTVISSSGLNTSTGGQLVKEGAGELTVSAAGNFTGGTTVNGGDLRVNATGALGSGAVNLTQPGVSLLTGNGVSLSNDINVAAYAGYGEGGSFIISEYIEGSGNNKYIELFNGTAEAIDLTAYRVVVFANSAASPTGTQNLGALTGGPATLAAGQTLVLKNSSASLGLPVGVTGFNSAVANFNGDDALALQSADGSVNYDIFGVIGNDPGSAWTAGDLSTLDQTLTRDGSVLTGVTVNPSGTGPSAFTTLGTQWTGYPIDTVSNLGSHKMNLGSGVAIVGSDVAGASVTYAGSVNLATTAQLTAASEGLTTFSGVLSGSAGITKTGAGTVTLSGNNTFTGGVAINDGALSVGADNNLGGADGAINLGGGTLAITETFTLGSGRLVTLATDTTSTLSVGDTKTLTFDGDFTGAGALDKTGLGILALGGASTGYTGNFGINAGTVRLTANNVLANALITQNGGVLEVTATGDVQIGDLAGGGSADVAISSGSTAVVGNRGGNQNFQGAIRGQGGLRKEGEGDFILSGNNDFTGAAVVSGGRLVVASGGRITAASSVTAQSGSELRVNGRVDTSVSISSGALLSGAGEFGGFTSVSGTHNPGNSPGLTVFEAGLEYNSTAVLNWELSANTANPLDRGVLYDAINVTGGNLTITSGAALNLVFTAPLVDSTPSTVSWSDSFWDTDRSWTLISFAGGGNSIGNFALGSIGLDIGGLALTSERANASFSVDRFGDDIMVNYQAVPEPSTYALLALAAAGLAAYRIRRRARR